MLKLRRVVRPLIIRILAGIITISISILFIIFKLLLLLPLPSNSYLLYDFKYSLRCCTLVKLQNIIHIILNTTLSLLSALMIASYCQYMLSFVQWISHQTHVVFLSLVFPNLPQLSTYTPSFIVVVYLGIGYLGISAQLALTLDLIYIYNVPAIYMYKILAKMYSSLLKSIKYVLQIIEYDHERWLTCQYLLLIKLSKINKLIGLGVIVVLAQVLIIVSFYYVWLTVVIVILICIMNVLRNVIEIMRVLSFLLLILKGYTINQQVSTEHLPQKPHYFLSRVQLLKNIPMVWIPLLKLQDIQNIFLGEDITKLSSLKFSLLVSRNFNPISVYYCMVNSSYH